jgi:hypothetical protein
MQYDEYRGPGEMSGHSIFREFMDYVLSAGRAGRECRNIYPERTEKVQSSSNRYTQRADRDNDIKN